MIDLDDRMGLIHGITDIYIEKTNGDLVDLRSWQLKKKDYWNQPWFKEELVPYFVEHYQGRRIRVVKEMKSIELFRHILNHMDPVNAMIDVEPSAYFIRLGDKLCDGRTIILREDFIVVSNAKVFVDMAQYSLKMQSRL